MEIQATNILDAYYQCMDRVIHKGQDVPPPVSKFSVGNSRYSKEIMNLSIRIINPHYWFIEKCPERDLKKKFPLGSFMWTLFAREDVNFIKFYNPRAEDFCEKNGCFHGAYGPRIKYQLKDCLANLKKDKHTRRSMIVIFDPRDILYESKDIPCVCSLHFLIRDNRLHMTTHMRSQSVTMILPYDLALFCAIQQMMATLLNIEIGINTHFCSSAHIYENEIDFTRKNIRS